MNIWKNNNDKIVEILDDYLFYKVILFDLTRADSEASTFQFNYLQIVNPEFNF